MVCDDVTGDNELDASDCCGNGCANCILDNKPKTSVKSLLTGKKNIILNYTKFVLVHKTAHTAELEEVLDLHFKYLSSSTTDVDNERNVQTNDHILDIPPGHHIMMRAPLLQISETTESSTVLRPYSPYWSDFTKMEFKILVNLKPNGPMSKYISKLPIGDAVDIRGPIGNYTHDASSQKCIFIVTQGVAIAPTIPIVESVLDNDDDLSRIYHIICCTDLMHIYFRKRLMEFAKYWNYRNRIYLAHPQCCDCMEFRASLGYKENVLPRRLDAEQLCEVVCNATSDGEKVLIVSGSNEFQRKITDYVYQTKIEIESKNIFLL